MTDLREKLMEINVANYAAIAQEVMDSPELQEELRRILIEEEDQSVLLGSMITLWEIWRREPEMAVKYLPLVAARVGFHLRPVRDYASTIMLKFAETHPAKVAKFAEAMMHRIDGDPYEQDDVVRFLGLIGDVRPDLVRRYKDRIIEMTKSSNPLLRLHAKRVAQKLRIL